VVDSIAATVQHTLTLADSADVPAQLSTVLHMKIDESVYADDKQFKDEVEISYNPAPVQTSARNPMSRSGYAESVSAPSPSVELQQRTWPLGHRRISNNVLLQMKSGLVVGDALEYTIVYSQFPTPMAYTALHPAINIRASELPLFDGHLRVLDSRGQFLTNGNLRVKSSSAHADLTPLYYGVFLSTEVVLRSSSLETVTYLVTLKFESSRKAPTGVKLQYPPEILVDYFAVENQLREYNVPAGSSSYQEEVICNKVTQ